MIAIRVHAMQMSPDKKTVEYDLNFDGVIDGQDLGIVRTKRGDRIVKK